MNEVHYEVHMTQVLYTAKISNVNSVMFVNKLSCYTGNPTDAAPRFLCKLIPFIQFRVFRVKKLTVNAADIVVLSKILANYTEESLTTAI